MAQEDEDQFAALAVGLNEDAKAERKAKAADPESEKPIEYAAEEPGETFEDEHPGAVAIETAAEEFDPEPGEIVEKLRDLCLTFCKQLDKPWHLLSEAQQRDLAAAIEHGCEEAVMHLVGIIAARGQQPVRVLLKKVALGEKIQITGEVHAFGESQDAAVSLLHHAIGKHVMLTRATVDDYKGGGGEAEIDADEPQIDFEVEGDDADLAGEDDA